MTSSWLVAKKFGKEHFHVLRDIRVLIDEMARVGGQTVEFIPQTYTHPQNGVQYQLYIMDESAFSLLVMGFTGEQALKFKLDYIAQFKTMREWIHRQSVQQQVSQCAIPAEIVRQARCAERTEKSYKGHRFSELREMSPMANGVLYSWTQMYGILHRLGYLCSVPGNKHYPTRKTIDAGYMTNPSKNVEERHDLPMRKRRQKKPLLTGKGLQFFCDLLTGKLMVEDLVVL